MNAIDKDPTLEGVLYTPARPPKWSRLMCANMIASSSIQPPEGESAAVRRADWITGACVLCFIALAVTAFLVTAFVRW